MNASLLSLRTPTSFAHLVRKLSAADADDRVVQFLPSASWCPLELTIDAASREQLYERQSSEPRLSSHSDSGAFTHTIPYSRGRFCEIQKLRTYIIDLRLLLLILLVLLLLHMLNRYHTLHVSMIERSNFI